MQLFSMLIAVAAWDAMTRYESVRSKCLWRYEGDSTVIYWLRDVRRGAGRTGTTRQKLEVTGRAEPESEPGDWTFVLLSLQ